MRYVFSTISFLALFFFSKRESGFCNHKLTSHYYLFADTTRKCDPISKSDFFQLAYKGMLHMSKLDTLSISETVGLVKIYNTFHLSKVINTNDSFFVKGFVKKFREEYFPIVAKVIGFTYGKGMTYYCSEYDIYIGPSMVYRCQDFYHFKENYLMSNRIPKQ